MWQKIFRYSGHWLSQLGSYHQCLREKDYTYLLMHIVPDINIFGLFFDVGFCLPDVCANKNFDTIAFIDSALSSLELTNITKKWEDYKQKSAPTFDLYIPANRLSDRTFTSGDIAMSIVIGFLVLLGLLGMVVEFTPLGNLPGKKDEKKVENKKRKWAKCCLAFSYSLNMKKLITVGGDGSNDLKVFNGLRTIGMCYVVLGHSYFLASAYFVTSNK